MTAITIHGYLHASPTECWNKEHAHGMRFTFFEHRDLTSSGYVMVRPYTMEFDLPDGWDPRIGQVEALRAEEKRLREQFVQDIAKVQSAISSLLVIEMAPL